MNFIKHILPLVFSILPLLSPGQITCTEVSLSSGIDHHYLSPNYMGGGAAFFDFDRDDDEDIWLAGGLNPDKIFRNEGNGFFTEISSLAGLDGKALLSSGVITGDLDNDGYSDVLVFTHKGYPLLLYRNQGDGTFTEVSSSAGLGGYLEESHAAAMGDVNLDGYLDIYVGTYIDTIKVIKDDDGMVSGFEHRCFDNLLFINNGDWTFREMSDSLGVKDGGCALATTFTDFDGDADADIMIANDFGEWIIPNRLYQNHQAGSAFSDISQMSAMAVGMYGMGIAIGDYDQDEDLDYYFTNLGRNVLMRNEGNKQFLDQSTELGLEDTYMDSLLATGWGTAFMDVDNDRDLDLFVCNGYVPAAGFISNSEINRNRLFLNRGSSAAYVFEETALVSGLDDGAKGRGFATADYDNDGDLDFLVINVNQRHSTDPLENLRLFRNDNDNGKHWLKVKLEGIQSNRDAFGSRIKIVVGSDSWVHDYNGGFGSHTSQHSSIAHFGLGDAQLVDSLIVSWPGGAISRFSNIFPDQMLKISEDGKLTDIEGIEESEEQTSLEIYPNPFQSQSKILFRLSRSSMLEIEISDLTGRRLRSFGKKYYTAGEHLIDFIPEGSSGWGIVRLETEWGVFVRRFFRRD